jgi:hypothetical protein
MERYFKLWFAGAIRPLEAGARQHLRNFPKEFHSAM